MDLHSYPGMVTIHRGSEFQGMCYQVKSGDFDGDGHDDVLFTGIGSFSEGDGGHAMILHGRTIWPREMDIDSGNYDWFYRSGESNVFLGAGAYLIQVNNDQAADLVIGDPGFSYADRANSGTVYIFLGQPTADLHSMNWVHYR